MNSSDLKKRLQFFAVRIIKMAEKLPSTAAGNAVRNQIVRSGSSPGANYRAACLAKSKKDFINKLKMVEEELDETIYWLEIIILLELLAPNLLGDLAKEANELFLIITRAIKTSKENERKEKEQKAKIQSVNP